MSITVWCDDGLHPANIGTAGPEDRRWIFVAEFHKPNILWLAAKLARHGVKWWADERSNNLQPAPGGGQRAHALHTLTCRYCKRPLIVRAGELDMALDLIAAARRTDVTLAELSDMDGLASDQIPSNAVTLNTNRAAPDYARNPTGVRSPRERG